MRFGAVVEARIWPPLAGCSIAYHLTLMGWRDVVLVERGQLTGGSTHRAAGLIARGRVIHGWPSTSAGTRSGLSASGWSAGSASTVVSQTAFFLGVTRLGPAQAALVAASEPVMALTWLAIFLGESLRPIQFVGAGLVIIGGCSGLALFFIVSPAAIFAV